MKRPIPLHGTALLTVLVAATTLALCATTAQSFGSFTPPGSQPAGIDFVSDGGRGGTIYHVDNYSGDVYSLTTGGVPTLLFNIAESVGQPYTYWHGNDVCFVPSGSDQRSGTLYITRVDRGASPYEDYVRSFSTDGTHINTYDVTDIVDRPRGIAFDGTHFWLSSDGGFVKCDTDFNFIEQYTGPWGSGNGALDFDPATGYLYNVGLGYNYVTVMDRSCALVWNWYLNSNYRVGIAVGPVSARDSRTLWIVDNTAIVIEEIEDQYFTPVEGGSWGSIKAMFR